MYKAPVRQQQSGGGPSPMVAQSPRRLSMPPSMHPGSTPLGHFPPSGISGASPDGLGTGCWWDSNPMQPHMDAPTRLITSPTSGSFTHVLRQQGLADNSQAALAGESPDSAKSARMVWDLSSRQAVGGWGHNQAATAEFAASSMRPLQSQVLHASSASLMAYGAVSPAYQPRVSASWSAGQGPDTAPNAALLPSNVGQKRKAAESQVFKGRLDDLDRIDLEGILGGAATAASWEASGDIDGGAHAEDQHLQLGSMASEVQVQASAQQVLPAAAAAAADTRRPRKKRKTGHKSSSPRAVPTAPVPDAAHRPAQRPGMHAAHPVGQDRPVTGPLRTGARPRYQPYARRCPKPQRQRKAQPKSQAQPQVAAPPSNPAAAPAAAPAPAPAAAPTQGSGYQVEQVVWGKSRGCPWWPATVSPCSPQPFNQCCACLYLYIVTLYTCDLGPS